MQSTNFSVISIIRFEEYVLVSPTNESDSGSYSIEWIISIVKFFSSITSKDIAEQIKKQHNIEVDKRKITLDEPIRVLGSRFVDIKIHQKVTTKLRVDVKEKQ